MARILSLTNVGRWESQTPAKATQLEFQFADIQDPCKNCELRGVCDSDDCAMHLFSLDTPTKFRNLNEFINFKKAQGWG
jgi:hypothetical protein